MFIFSLVNNYELLFKKLQFLISSEKLSLKKTQNDCLLFKSIQN